MSGQTDPAQQNRPSSNGDLILIWICAVVALVLAMSSAGYVFGANIRAYALCGEQAKAVCSDAGWFSSMAIALVGGIGAVLVGAASGLRQYGMGRRGVWFPLGSILAVGVVTLIAVLSLRLLLPQ